MAEHLHGDASRNPLLEKESGRGVAGVVKTGVADVGALEQCLPRLPVGARVDRPAVDLGEDKAILLPGLAGVLPLVLLRFAMRLQALPQRGGQRDRPAAGLALGLDHHQALALEPLEGPPHGQRPGLEVDVAPLQSECLTLTQPESQRDGPARCVATLLGRFQEPPCLVGAQGFDLLAAQARGVHEGADVPGHPRSLDGDLEGAGQDPMALQNGGRGEPLSPQVGVESLEVLGLEPIEAMVTERRDDPLPDVRRVALVGERTHPGDGDGGQPVLEPHLESRSLAGLGERPCISLALECPDLPHDGCSRSAGDVPAVPGATAAAAHRHVAVPAAAVVLLDRALTPRCSGHGSFSGCLLPNLPANGKIGGLGSLSRDLWKTARPPAATADSQATRAAGLGG